MATSRVVVESADHHPTSYLFELGTTTESVKIAIRQYLSVMGGGFLEKKKKESGSADVFTVITDDYKAREAKGSLMMSVMLVSYEQGAKGNKGVS